MAATLDIRQKQRDSVEVEKGVLQVGSKDVDRGSQRNTKNSVQRTFGTVREWRR